MIELTMVSKADASPKKSARSVRKASGSVRKCQGIIYNTSVIFITVASVKV